MTDQVQTVNSSNENEKASNQIIQIKPSQLPLCCPLPDSDLWNMHPRVYLEIEKVGKIKCPYCGAIYQLEDQA
ncbi:zinc-finger domain-containing protein [Pleionea sediminis]|uniref:zinc-finger domain-containing protein n=1 Tax=Pleionea sediminis TaxID=2569479 RepID=UPI001186F6BB|nr:zinc-finger domain-containing protein [Pleionea sediminis]